MSKLRLVAYYTGPDADLLEPTGYDFTPVSNKEARQMFAARQHLHNEDPKDKTGVFLLDLRDDDYVEGTIILTREGFEEATGLVARGHGYYTGEGEGHGIA